jgi:ElaB/YqjD/DUF883 family membrane-anchored ribosome-binding protein
MVKKSQTAHDAVAEAAQSASEAGRRLAELGSAIQERTRDTLRTSHRTSHMYTRRLRDYVAHYPLASVGAALTIGAIVSAIVLSRR